MTTRARSTTRTPAARSAARRIKTTLWAALGLTLAASAQAAWPERELHFVVNYSAGGATDVATRLLARAMEPHLGQSMVIENRAGGQGTVAPGYVARQAADGYTVSVVTHAAIAISPHVVPTTYTADDFAFIGGFGRFRFGLAVNAAAPYQSPQELIDAARREPLFFGVSGATQALAFFEMNAKYGTQFEQILYKSGTDAIVALGAGQVQASVQNPSEVMPQVDAGRVRLLASASPTHWHNLPEMPTLKELGIDIEVDSWMGLAVPAGTPPEARAKLEAALEKAVQDPAFRDGMHALGLDAVWASGQDFDRMLRADFVRMRVQMEQAGLPLLKK